MPKRCAKCDDPNWHKPRRWFKPSTKTDKTVQRESRLDDDKQPRPPALSKEDLDEATRNDVIKSMYPTEGRKGYLPIFSIEACPSLFMFNNPYQAVNTA